MATVASPADHVRSTLLNLVGRLRLSELEALLDAMHTSHDCESAGSLLFDIVDAVRLGKLDLQERSAPQCRCGRQQTETGVCPSCDAWRAGQ